MSHYKTLSPPWVTLSSSVCFGDGHLQSKLEAILSEMLTKIRTGRTGPVTITYAPVTLAITTVGLIPATQAVPGTYLSAYVAHIAADVRATVLVVAVLNALKTMGSIS